MSRPAAEPVRRLRGVAGRVRSWAGAVRWYVHAVMGDDAYQRYLAHLRAAHPGEPEPTEREFWRDRYAEQETRPNARCC